jgi:hypothetical protein
MADNKRIYKCSLCHEVGHNKAKCPTQKKQEIAETAAPAKVETKPQLETIYQITVEEDNGDDVSKYYLLYRSIDGLTKGLEKVINNIKEEQVDLENETEEEEEEEDEYSYTRHLLYHSKKESFKDVPIPTKEYIEAYLKNRGIRYLNGLIIEAGSMRGAACFACNIYVTEQTLNP